jgi:hypothetical protein
MNAEPLHGFEQRLLGELRRVVDETPAPQSVVQRRPSGTLIGRRPLAVAGGLAAIAGVFAATGVWNGAENRAYAVSENGDGSVTVQIASLSDADGLQNKLRAAGVPAVVQYLPPGKACAGGPGAGFGAPPPDGADPVESGFDTDGPHETGAPSTQVGGIPSPGEPAPPEALPPGAVTSDMRMNDDGSVEFTIDAPGLDGRSIVIRNQDLPPESGPNTEAAPPAGTPASVGVEIANGPPKPCKVVDASH